MDSSIDKAVDSKILSFIDKHHVLILATSVDNRPWCANMFYAYLPNENLFVFTSDGQTKHASDAALNDTIAASIVFETRTVGRVQGLQLRGIMRRVREGEVAPRTAYIKRFPYALAAKLNLWVIEPHFFKLTDNTLGFGKKLYWQSKEYEEQPTQPSE